MPVVFIQALVPVLRQHTAQAVVQLQGSAHKAVIVVGAKHLVISLQFLFSEIATNYCGSTDSDTSVFCCEETRTLAKDLPRWCGDEQQVTR